MRPSESDITTSHDYDDKAESQWEQQEIEKAYTLSVENFKGEDPVLAIAREWPELKEMTDRDFVIEKLENDKEVRMKVCEKHLFIRYILDGLGFEFPLDEQTQAQDPENTQVWNEFETQFQRATDIISQQEEAIDVAIKQVDSCNQDIDNWGSQMQEICAKEMAEKKNKSDH